MELFCGPTGSGESFEGFVLLLARRSLGHSLLSLMQGLPEPIQGSVTEELLDSAKALDKHYIPTRYPNGFAEGAPVDYYTKRDAEDSLEHAQSILAFCRSEIRKPDRSPEVGEKDGGADSGESS